jgi:hypothetical protein
MVLQNIGGRQADRNQDEQKNAQLFPSHHRSLSLPTPPGRYCVSIELSDSASLDGPERAQTRVEPAIFATADAT